MKGNNEIAIIGVSLRFPKTNTLDELWDHLVSEKSLITEVPSDRWDKDKYFGDPRREANKTNSIWGGFIDDADCFDASFFKISPREAALMDPQQRISLELAWKAIEDAGYRPSSLKASKTGVFMGVSNTDYTEIIEKHVQEVDAYVLTGNSYSILSNRISYCFDFKGPSVTIDAACASSLVAIHQAVRSLENKECEYALAGGVNLCWSPRRFIALSQGGTLSKDGKCRAFDESANGYVRGEGGAILVLKPLYKAIENHDHIYAVIKGVGTNHGGRTSSLTVTNPKAHADLIVEVYEKAGVSPDTVSYIDAHGVGSPLGDSMEIHGLKTAFSQLFKKWNKEPKQSICGIGSVKTNIGHLEAAAGMAGVIKIVASMKQKRIPASINFNQLNSVINLEESPFYIVNHAKPWEVGNHDNGSFCPRRAGVSAFGFGGCNAHLILEEYISKKSPEQCPKDPVKIESPVLIPLSARNSDRLQEYAKELLAFLKKYTFEKVGLDNDNSVSGALRGVLEQNVALMLSEVLQVRENEVDIQQEFSDYGVEPIHLSQLLERLQEKFKFEINGREFLKIDSITSIATHLLEHYPESIMAHNKAEKEEQFTSPEAGRISANPQHQPLSLSELAYNLQLGRDAMEERVIFLVKGIPELVAKLEAFIQGKERITNCWRGQVKQGKKIVSLLTDDEESQEQIQKWIAKSKVRKIAGLWVQGFPIDWELFYFDAKPRRISLPTYPFARERHWIPETNPRDFYATGPALTAVIHPLLHQNTSDFSEQRFSSIFTGQEFFLKDHVVKGRRILPGVACLEMARAAVVQSAGILEEGRTGIRLKNVVWVQPITVGEQPVRVHIGLFPKDNGEIAYEIYSKSEAVDVEPVVHSQGSAALSPVAEAPALELEAIQAQCIQSTLSPAQCYEAYRAMGIEYGPGHQGIEMVYVGTGQVLAKLSLPSFVLDTRDQFVLHPSLMDSALQASVGLMVGLGDLKPALPFTLQQIEIFNKCMLTMWTLIRYSDGSKAGDKVEKLDIDLCDEHGAICVKLKGLSLRVLEDELKEMNQKPLLMTTSISSKPEKAPATSYDPAGIDTNVLLDKVQWALVQAVAKLLKVKIKDIDVDTELNDYGFGSITFTEFANNLNQEYELELTPTLFFEHPTLHDFAEYLVREYEEVFAKLFSTQNRSETPVQAMKDKAEENLYGKRYRSRFARTVALSASQPDIRAYESVAIVGMSGRFPMAEDVNEFWRNLVEGRDCITEIPKDRWKWEEYYGNPIKEANKTNIKWGGFIDGIDQFDPLFFRISPREAETMDPQQRLLLTYAWKALEDAGITAGALSQTPTGVFIAAGPGEYRNIVSVPQDNLLVMTSIMPSFIPNRISYILNLHGPSEYFETACSSTFVTLHRAIQAIHSGECEQAIVGAVNLLLTPTGFIGFEAMGYLSPEGKSKSFQAGANGYVRSEGVGAIIIKPLRKAVEDQDLIYAVIKGTGVSHGGKGMSLTAPNPSGIKAAMIQAYQASGIDPRTVSYIEGHGIASPLGDGIEVNALKAGYQELAALYSQDSQAVSPCYISSLKPCIGHGEVASGMAELIKVILAMRHKLIPGVPWFTTLHENIILKGSPFQITAEDHHWEALADTNGKILPRRASINSYGFGGVNAHVVLEEYIPPHEETVQISSTISPQIVVFSAKNPDRLQAVVQQMLEFVELQKEISLSNLAYTLQIGREAMESRVAMVASSREELIRGMKEYLESMQEHKEIEASIPILTGELQEEHSEIRSLLSGRVGESLSQVLLAEKSFEKLAFYWTKGGRIPWESLHEGEGVHKVSLPTYPFDKKRYWISQVGEQHSVKEEKNRSLADQANEPLNANRLSSHIKKRISELLGIPLEELPTRKMLNSLGFSSLQAVTLRYFLEQEFGAEIPIAVVSEHQTIEQIEGNLKEILKLEYTPEANCQITSSISDILPEIVPNIADRYQPFPLNDIQESFLTGRKLRFGGDWVGCHIYFEVDVRDLDIYRLNKAWERLIGHHEMLRAVILSNGQQKVLDNTPPYRFITVDLRRKNDLERSGYLDNVRKKMSHKVYEPEQWPLFEIRISVCPDSKYVIHFSIDEFILDASGVYMLLQQWRLLYEDPVWKIPELNVFFRDYVLAIKRFESSKRYRRDLGYWTGKLENMPEGPKLPLRLRPEKPDDKDNYYRTRLNGILEDKQWHSLKMKAEKLSVSPTALLLSIFIEVLRLWSDHETFSLILTFFNRLPLHSQLDLILGPFMSTSIFVVEEKRGRGLEEIIKDNQERLWNDLDHSSVSGIRVLRELKANRKISGSLYLPVVFTSLVNNFGTESAANKDSFFKQVSFMVTQTPQVYLDHQVFEQDGKLKFSWDVAEGYFESAVIRDIFSDYCRVLHMLSSEGSPWELEALASEVKGRKCLIRDGEYTSKDAAEMSQRAAVLSASLKLETSTTDKHKPFPLTDQQQAYAFGRYMARGNNSCQVYQEVEAEGLDLNRLGKAWQKLMKTHEMLITVIRTDGTQRILEEVPDFKIKVADLTGKKAEEVQADLIATKRLMMEHVFNLGEWPFFDLRVSVMDSRKSRIHFMIDMLIADANSIHLLLEKLFYFYENPTGEPDKPGVLFRDYVLSLQRYKKTEGYQRSIQYWENKFAEIPPGPQLPRNNGENAISFEHEQFKGMLWNWEVLKETAGRLSVSPSMILLTAYAEVFAAWLNHKPFSIVIPCWERLPLHPKINEIVGDFTAMSWVVSREEKESFEEKVRLNHTVVQEDLSHMAVSGLKALRKAVVRGVHKGMLTFPVVFTNMMTHSSAELPKGFKRLEMFSKTPQVYLDNISVERNGQLFFFWDVVKGVYPEGMMEEMFTGYKRVLEALANESGNWGKIEFDRLINAQPEKYINSIDSVRRVV